MYNVLSLGAGVQSSTLAMMYAKKELSPMPDFAVFADTQGEPETVYKWLDWLEKQLSFPVYKISTGNLKNDSLLKKTSRKSGNTYLPATVPFFLFKDGKRKGMLRRGCTRDYKLRPIQKFVRNKCKIKYGQKNICVNMIIGISTDEITRIKESKIVWIKNVYPLIENKISRQNCLDWFDKNNLELPHRSACTFCPYHNKTYWTELKKNNPKEFSEVVKYEKKAKKIFKTLTAFNGNYDISIHSSNNLENFTDKKEDQLDLFNTECEGMCGV